MTKQKLPAMSPAETEILRLVWQVGQATVQQVCESRSPPDSLLLTFVLS
ncbi:MAG: hypothetical protein P8Z79_06540 [Sedimentisphaerales bacterium]